MEDREEDEGQREEEEELGGGGGGGGGGRGWMGGWVKACGGQVDLFFLLFLH